jgi:hypothetical protein
VPAKIVEEYYASDCVRVIVAPPADVQSTDWEAWAYGAFPFHVSEVSRITENGRILLSVLLDESDEGEGEVKTPKTFRLVPPVNQSYGKSMPIVTVNMNGAEWTPPPPTPSQPPAKIDTCSKPVRVRSDTHARIRMLSKRLGLGVADTIDRAVTAMIGGKPRNPHG